MKLLYLRRSVVFAFRTLLITIACLVAGNDLVIAQTLSTSNQFVMAQVVDGSGLVSFFASPGPPKGALLSFEQHSYLSVMIDSNVYTNNPPANTSKPDVLGSGGTLLKVADSIYCTWKNVGGSKVDVIQKIYPVALESGGQIVISASFVNHGAAPIHCAAEYLLDIEVGSNDGPIVLTKLGYSKTWSQFTSAASGIPPYYAAWQFGLPNAPSYATTPSSEGLLVDPDLGLIVPSRATFGDGTQLTLLQWGPYGGFGPYGDGALLLEWPARSVGSGDTVEVMRTAYGTSNLVTCVGDLTGVFSYPHALSPDSTQKNFVGNPFIVDALLVNTNQTAAASSASLGLTVGPLLKITDPVGGLNSDSTSEVLNVATFIPAGGVADLSWKVQATLNRNCTGDSLSFLSFRSSSNLASGSFAKPTPCAEPILLPCTAALSDVLPPILSSPSIHSLYPKSHQIDVHDDRITDNGLRSITKTFVGSDDSHFLVSITPALAGSCDRSVHTVKVVQQDSTIGGCFYFAFTDCNSNVSYDTMCFAAARHDTVLGVSPISSVAIVSLSARENEDRTSVHFKFAASTAKRELAAYDLIGREVFRLEITAGATELNRAINSLASGAYVIRLGNEETKLNLVR